MPQDSPQSVAIALLITAVLAITVTFIQMYRNRNK